MAITEATARAVARREFPDRAVRAVRELPGGRKATFAVDLSGERIVVAVCDRPADERRFAVEPVVMRIVRRETDVPVPRVLAVDRSKRAVPHMYYVTRRVEGYDPRARFKYLPRGTRAALVRAAGRHLGALHRSVGFEACGRLRADGDDVTVADGASWPAALGALMDDWIDGLGGGRFADLAGTFRRARRAIVARLAAASVSFPPALLHGDYRPANLIVRDGDVAAVVDWGSALAGHPEYDFFKFEKNFLLAQFRTPAVRQALRGAVYEGYREAAGLDPGWRGRRTGYRIAYKLESMRSFHRWCGEYDEAPDVLADRLRAELDDLLARFESGGEAVGGTDADGDGPPRPDI